MFSTFKTVDCLICKKQLEIMVSLDQTLYQYESITVAQALENLNFFTIQHLNRLGAVLCYICVAKVQSCFDFKTQCYQVGKELEIESAFHGSFDDSPLQPLTNITPYPIRNEPVEENCIENDNLSKSATIVEHQQQMDVEVIDKMSTNTATVVPETNANDCCTIKTKILENILRFGKDKLLTGSNNVDLNKQKNTGDTTFVCDVCNKIFPHRRNLRIHKRVHTGERPYVCGVCNKSFKCSSNLRKHKRIHTGERPYVCDICYKSFTCAFSLRIHYRGHTGEKPYPCDFCDKTFSCSSNLTLHRRTHTGEKPYVCKVCNKAYAQSFNLTEHLKNHGDQKSFVCGVCNRVFGRFSTFRRHKSIHNKSNANQRFL